MSSSTSVDVRRFHLPTLRNQQVLGSLGDFHFAVRRVSTSRGDMCSLYYNQHMSPIDRVVTFRPDQDLLKGMQALKDRDGVPYSEQIRRSLRMWLDTKGVFAQTPRRRGATARKTRKGAN
jgi:hypothetical protein